MPLHRRVRRNGGRGRTNCFTDRHLAGTMEPGGQRGRLDGYRNGRAWGIAQGGHRDLLPSRSGHHPRGSPWETPVQASMHPVVLGNPELQPSGDTYFAGTISHFRVSDVSPEGAAKRMRKPMGRRARKARGGRTAWPSIQGGRGVSMANLPSVFLPFPARQAERGHHMGRRHLWLGLRHNGFRGYLNFHVTLIRVPIMEA